MAEAIDNGDTAAALAWVKSRQLHTVDVTKVGRTDPERIIDAQAVALRQRPEYKSPGSDPMDLLNDLETTISKTEARSLVEAELSELLD